jgi:hypothetical protein
MPIAVGGGIVASLLVARSQLDEGRKSQERQFNHDFTLEALKAVLREPTPEAAFAHAQLVVRMFPGVVSPEFSREVGQALLSNGVRNRGR